MFSTTIEAGDVYAHRMAGGGGWGDPLARDPAAVADDVANEKVSVAAARELYGVVIGADGAADARRDGRPAKGEETRVIGKADAVVIGGGIMGASTAHFLTKLGFGDVALVEKRKICGGSTQYSAAHVRQHYSNEVGIRLAVRGAAMFNNAEEELGGPAGFHQIGYMLFAPPEEAQALRDTVAVQRELRRRDVDARARRGREPLAPAPARGRRARVLRADVRLRRSRAHGRDARRAPRSATASTSTRAARCSASRPRAAASPASSPATARSRPASSSTRAARGATASAAWPASTTRSSSAASTRRSSTPPRASRTSRSSRTCRRRSTAGRTSAARSSSATAGRSRRSRSTPRPTTTAPTTRT